MLGSLFTSGIVFEMLRDVTPNQSAAANGFSAVRSSVAGVRERNVRSTAAAEAVAELGRSAITPISLKCHSTFPRIDC